MQVLNPDRAIRATQGKMIVNSTRLKIFLCGAIIV